MSGLAGDAAEVFLWIPFNNAPSGGYFDSQTNDIRHPYGIGRVGCQQVMENNDNDNDNVVKGNDIPWGKRIQ